MCSVFGWFMPHSDVEIGTQHTGSWVSDAQSLMFGETWVELRERRTAAASLVVSVVVLWCSQWWLIVVLATPPQTQEPCVNQQQHQVAPGA